MAHPDWTVPAGEMIPATLGVAMNSELPGMIMAVTERDIYSLTGEHVLIPRGSKLVGQYNSSVVQGQSRFLVVWNRVQLANGVIVSINSQGSDSLGRSGLQADSIDRHFLERFGGSSLLSIIGAFAANQGVDSNTKYNSAAEYRSAIASSFSQAAQQSFERDRQIKPTLDKYQGAEITVFVSRDLDFSSVAKLPMPQGRLVRNAPWK
jgi:type IV secretion system protein VirB10